MTDSPRPVPDPPASAARFGDGGDYYYPGLSARDPELVLAAWFFLAADEELPEIRAFLRSEVYERLPFDRVSLYRWRDEEDRWRLHEDDWNPPLWAAPASGYVLGSTPMLAGVLALRTWARRYRLTSHPLMEVAVRILSCWEGDEFKERAGRQPPSTSGWGQDFDILANGWDSLPDKEREDLREIDRRSWFYHLLAPFRADVSDRWDPRFETRRGFAQRMEERLARQLDHYLDRSESGLQEHGFKKVPRKAARHHLSWLVQHRLLGLTYEEIADRYAAEKRELESPPTGDAVAKAVRRTAAILELT